MNHSKCISKSSPSCGKDQGSLQKNKEETIFIGVVNEHIINDKSVGMGASYFLCSWEGLSIVLCN